MRNLAALVWRTVVIALWSAREILRTAWAIVRAPLMLALNILAALVVLFEEWGWKPLAALLAKFARFGPIAVVERWIAGISPYAALFVFALPTTILLPLKFVAMWLLASGRYWAATGLFLGAKIASTALIARIFILTKPALMRVAWFARAYTWFVPWKDALFGEIRASWVWRYGRRIKARVKLEAGQGWERWRPALTDFAASVRTQARARWQSLRDALFPQK